MGKGLKRKMRRRSDDEEDEEGAHADTVHTVRSHTNTEYREGSCVTEHDPGFLGLP